MRVFFLFKTWLPAGLLALLLVACGGSGSPVNSAKSISQYGITWTWLEERPIGQFANGDYWVVGPITLTGISPSSAMQSDTSVSNYTANGSMINPISGLWVDQGFDSRLNQYVEALNVARKDGAPLSANNTRTVAVGSSISSSVSRQNVGGGHSYFNDFAVLTVVATAPAAGSFRPPYIGTDKTITWNKSQLDYGILKNLAPVSGMNAPTSAAFTRPWMIISTQYNQARDFCAVNNQVEYDRDMAWVIGGALLELHQNYSNAEKELAYVRIVQHGIDMYGAVKYGTLVEGGKTYSIGQENTGPKGAVVLAALALNDADMKYYVDASHTITNPWIGGGTTPVQRWGPDGGSCYVPASAVGAPVNDQYLLPGDPRPRYTYTAQMQGLPEWLLDSCTVSTGTGSNWGNDYRNVRYGGMVGMALAMQLTTGARAAWNWPAFFDYIDRAYTTYTTSADTAGDQTLPYVKAFWAANRSLGNPQWPQAAPVSGIGWIPPAGNAFNIEFTDNVTTGAGGNGGLVITASGGPVTATYVSGNGTTRRTYSLSRTIGAGETVTYAYTQPGHGVEAYVGGADVATVTSIPVVNYSTGI